MSIDLERLIILEDFEMPQLGRRRTVRIRLPRDYTTSERSYPVIYMHDGQNVFDDNTATYGRSWRVGETLDAREERGLPSAIVVAVDCGADFDGMCRYHEYSPWPMDANFILPGRTEVNLHQFGGQGLRYIQFLVDTLKPYMDAHYRTLPDRDNTVLAGSSMGGYISLYGGLSYPQVFGALGVFSPAFWFNHQAMFDWVGSVDLTHSIKIYMDMGMQETSDHAREDFAEVYLHGSRAMREVLSDWPLVELEYVEAQNHQHNEEAWSLRFPYFVEWTLGK